MEYGFVIGGLLLAFVMVSLYQHFRTRQRAQILLERSHLLDLGQKIKLVQKDIQHGYSPEAPPVLKTSKELIMTYMISEDNSIPIFLHNFSIVSPKHPWNTRVQTQLIAYICNLIGSSDPHSVQYSNTGILHFSFLLDTEEEHRQFFSTPIEVPEFPRAFLQLSTPITIEKVNILQTENS